MIRGVLFDLDDTLFEQRQWLDQAWRAVAVAAASSTDPDELFDELVALAGEGSAKGRIIDRALERVGASSSLVPELVAVFREFHTDNLAPYPGAREGLSCLHLTVRTGLVTDGEPGLQRAKLRSLGLEDMFDVVVFSDELGRDRRKPHPAPFRTAVRQLGLDVDAIVHVGDHPWKDVAGAIGAGIRAVRVLTGEYRDVPSDPEPWFTAPTVVHACQRLLLHISGCLI